MNLHGVRGGVGGRSGGVAGSGFPPTLPHSGPLAYVHRGVRSEQPADCDASLLPLLKYPGFLCRPWPLRRPAWRDRDRVVRAGACDCQGRPVRTGRSRNEPRRKAGNGHREAEREVRPRWQEIGIDFPLRNGSIVAANPKRFAPNRCSPGVHDAVWLLRTKTVDGRFVIRLPLYVDKIDPAAANANSVYRMQMCFSSPNGRTRISGWPSRTLFRTMNLLFDSSVISEQPTIPARYVWHGVFTPFRVKPGSRAKRRSSCPSSGRSAEATTRHSASRTSADRSRKADSQFSRFETIRMGSRRALARNRPWRQLPRHRERDGRPVELGRQRPLLRDRADCADDLLPDLGRNGPRAFRPGSL